jgi:hypothetical protein
VIVERFGTPSGPCYLTVYNLAETPQTVGLTLTGLKADGCGANS